MSELKRMIEQAIVAGVMVASGSGTIVAEYSKCSYTDGLLTKFEEGDGIDVIRTTDFTYDGDGNLSTIVETTQLKTTTITLTYIDGVLDHATRVVS